MTHPLDTTFRGRKVLITGGLGFIGSNLAHRLVALHADVMIVDNLWPDYGGNLFNIDRIADHVRVNISDVRDEHSLRYLVQDKDFIFNLAGQTSHMDSMRDPFTDLDINCKAQLYILESCKKFNPSARLIFASTRQIYGRPESLPVSESHPLHPVDINGVNKLAGEAYHSLYFTVHGIRSSVLRLTNTYGPHMRVKDARQTFLGEWLRLLIQGLPFEVWGGTQLRDFNYVDDVVQAMLQVSAHDESLGKVYNLGGERPVNLEQLAHLLVEANQGGEFIIRPFPDDRKAIDIGDYYADYRSISSDLGWTPKVSIEEGLRETLGFYRKHLNRYL